MIKLLGEYLCVFWAIIFSIIFILSIFFRKKINKQPVKVFKLALSKNESSLSVIIKVFKDLLIYGLLMLVIYFILNQLDLEKLFILVQYCKTVLVIGFMPYMIDWLKDSERNNKKNINLLLFLCTGLLICIIGTYQDFKTEIEKFLWIKNILSIILSLFLVLFVIALMDFRKLTKKKNLQIISSRNNKLYRDLFNRIPNMKVDKWDKMEIGKLCEIYFSEFIEKKEKVGKIKHLEFSTLFGLYKDKWYDIVHKKMKILWWISIVFSAMLVFTQGYIYGWVSLILLLGFLINIHILKKVDKIFLCRLAIRYFYAEWGYYIQLDHKDYFVGNVSIIEWWKCFKFVHSFLNIAALCRISTYLTVENTESIDEVVNQICELTIIYEDTIDNDIYNYLPLWISTIYEYKHIGLIRNEQAKILLRDNYNKNKEAMQIFISTFWIDMTRVMPNVSSGEFIKNYFSEIFEN